MKELDDIYIKNELKGLPEVRKDEWFTRKVLNRLPEKKRSYSWIEYAIYAICGIVCGVCWTQFAHNLDLSVITVGAMLKYGCLLAVSTVLLWQLIRNVALAD